MSNKKVPVEANIFYPDTRFERLARRPGAVSREQAVEQAQAAVDELATDFGDWIDQQYGALGASLADLESNPSDKMALELSYQISAQLRDLGGTMGYTLVTFVATTLCEVLDAYSAGAPFDKTVTGCHMDAFLLARTEAYRRRRPEEVPELAEGLLRVVEVTSIAPTDEGSK